MFLAWRLRSVYPHGVEVFQERCLCGYQRSRWADSCDLDAEKWGRGGTLLEAYCVYLPSSAIHICTERAYCIFMNSMAYLIPGPGAADRSVSLLWLLWHEFVRMFLFFSLFFKETNATATTESLLEHPMELFLQNNSSIDIEKEPFRYVR